MKIIYNNIMVTPRRWRLDNDRGSVMTVETPPCAAATAVFSTDAAARWRYSKPVKIRFIYFRTIFFFVVQLFLPLFRARSLWPPPIGKRNKKKKHT